MAEATRMPFYRRRLPERYQDPLADNPAPPVTWNLLLIFRFLSYLYWWKRSRKWKLLVLFPAEIITAPELLVSTERHHRWTFLGKMVRNFRKISLESRLIPKISRRPQGTYALFPYKLFDGAFHFFNSPRDTLVFPMDVQAAKRLTTAAKRPAYRTRAIRELQVVRILGPIPHMSK